MTGILLVNGRFYTLDRRHPQASAVYIQNEHIVDVGDAVSLQAKYAGDRVETVDLQGYMILPGLTDSHMHLLAHGIKLQSLDFSACRNLFELKTLLQQTINRTPPGEWVVGQGWNENNLPEQKMLTKQELDECSRVHPIFLTRICGHAYMANSLALSMAGIDEQMAHPEGGWIEKDDHGFPNGLLLDQAGQLIKEHIPDFSEEQLNDALQLAIRDCWRAGLVGCHTDDMRDTKGLTILYRLLNDVLQGFPFRVHELIDHEYVQDMLEQGYSEGKGTSLFDVGAVKLFADGSIGGRSALLKEPYTDAPDMYGVAIHSVPELQRLLQQARVQRLPVAIHAIGDQALENALTALEAYPNQYVALPDRIIHAQVLRPEFMPRLAKLNLVVDIQPRFVATDFPWVANRLGETRLSHAYAWKSLLRQGIHCAGGSDAPIEPVDPLLGIHAAVTRQLPKEGDHGGYLPQEKLTLDEAIYLFTTGSAYAEQKQHLKGTITPGKVADFTVLDQDLYQVPPAQWLETKAVMTIIRGKIVYQK